MQQPYRLEPLHPLRNAGSPEGWTSILQQKEQEGATAAGVEPAISRGLVAEDRNLAP